MLRKMCKVCAPKGSKNYKDRKLTGEVTDIKLCGFPVFSKYVKIITCKECGHQWKFSRSCY